MNFIFYFLPVFSTMFFHELKYFELKKTTDLHTSLYTVSEFLKHCHRNPSFLTNKELYPFEFKQFFIFHMRPTERPLTTSNASAPPTVLRRLLWPCPGRDAHQTDSSPSSSKAFLRRPPSSNCDVSSVRLPGCEAVDSHTGSEMQVLLENSS